MPEMSSFHDIRIWVEKGLDAIEHLSKQVSRAAFAFEAMVRADIDAKEIEKLPCRCCGSRIVPVESGECMACGTPKEKKPDV